MSPRPTKKRLGKKHRQASTRPKKGRAPRNPPATGAQTSAASPRKRKLLAAKRAEQEKKRRTPTRSPEHESRKTVSKQSRPSRSLSTDNEQRTTHNDPDPESPEEVRAWDRAEQLATQFDLTNPSNLEPRTANLPLIAICGRPNVGKSTLFNRLTGSRRSIVGDEPGITRDRIYGLIDWANRAARLVDTGGIVPDDPSLIPAEIFHQAQTALTEADAIIMVIDGRTELASPDRDLARLLLRTGKPVFLAVNKIDTAALAPAAENFRRLGFRNVVPISAEHGSGIGDLLDDVFATLPTQTAAISPEPVILAQPESPYLPSTDNQPGAPSWSAGQGGSAATEDDSVILSEPHSGESKRPSQQSVILSEPHSGESKDLHLAHPATAARRPSAPEFPSAPSHPSQLTTDHLPLTTDRPRLLRSHGAYVETETRIAIIGRPNVGKSTLLNALTGTDRAIVSPIAGTTRDAVDELVTRAGHDFRFVDTAGIRRKGKTRLMAEKLSVVMARKHLEAADVSLLVLDATAGVTALDATIGGYAHESGRSVILVVNKWDLVLRPPTKSVILSEGRSAAAVEGTASKVPPASSTASAWDAKRSGSSAAPVDKRLYEQQIRDALKFLDYAPIVFVSAASATGLDALYKKIELVARERRKRVTTGQMNRFLARVDFQRASVPMKRRVKIYYMTQAAVAPPTFVLFTDKDVKLHFAFERFLANQIRETFGFIGSPIWFKTRPRNKKKPEE